jgi:FkbM family methyltransferase
VKALPTELLSRGRHELLRRRIAARAARFELAARRGDLELKVEVAGVTFFVDPRDRGVGFDLFTKRRRPEIIVLERTMSILGPTAAPRDVLVDIGANIGTTTILALRRHGFVEAVACEPAPVNAALLRVNAKTNGVEECVHVLEAAVSDAEGERLLDVGDVNAGGYEIAREGTIPSAAVPVRAVSLDGLVERRLIEPHRVGLLWIDAQGHEADVLAGADELLAAQPPLVIAYRPRKLRSADRLDLFLELVGGIGSRIVDLRAPSLRTPDWEPVRVTVGELASRDDNGTDLLVLK